MAPTVAAILGSLTGMVASAPNLHKVKVGDNAAACRSAHFRNARLGAVEATEDVFLVRDDNEVQQGTGIHHGTLEYMQSMLGQLREMAEARRLEMLTYLIDMAYVEAGEITRRHGLPLRHKGDGAA